MFAYPLPTTYRLIGHVFGVLFLQITAADDDDDSKSETDWETVDETATNADMTGLDLDGEGGGGGGGEVWDKRRGTLTAKDMGHLMGYGSEGSEKEEDSHRSANGESWSTTNSPSPVAE